MKHSLVPRPEPYPESISRILSSYPSRDGYLLQLFRVFAQSERFLKKGTVNLLDRESPVSMREREIVILRTCALRRCEYEWGVHVAAFADHVGLTPEQIADTLNDQVGECWSADEALLISVVDNLCRHGTVGDELLAGFQSTWDTTQQLEILALCGNYHTISFVANTANLPAEPFAATFDQRI